MTYKFDTLYARDSKGKVLQWNIEVQNNNGQVDIRMSYGEYNGGQQLKWQRDIQGKNIGKANETNAWEQAIKDAESAIARHKKKGYMTLEEVKALPVFDTPALVSKFRVLTDDPRDETHILLDKKLPKYRVDADGDVKPMKAQQYYRSKKDWVAPDGTKWSDRKYYYLLNPHVKKEVGAIIATFPCMAQPKINGVRCTIKLVDNKPLLKSKEGLEYKVAHINDFLTINNDIFSYEGIDLVLDGELYIHGELLQDIGSAIDKPNLNTPRVVFKIFDLAIEDKTNLERWNIIKDHIKPKLDIHINCPIELVKTTRLNKDEDAQAFTDICIAQGYEGIILRDFKALYGFGKRPVTMTKLKRTISREFKIVDIIPQTVDNTKGNFTCITAKGLRFDVNPNGTDEYKRYLLENKHEFIGKNLTCDFYEWTKDSKPLHIISCTVRDYE